MDERKGRGIYLGKLRLTIGPYGLGALVIIVLDACMRLILIAQNWPVTNSDEGTVGLMTLHIAYRGEHPIFFYGQSFMGTLEAYLGAVFFYLFGPSLFSLRIGVTLLFSLFLVIMYLLTSLLYTKKLALLVLVLLSLGSSQVFFRELEALAGHPETPLFGAALLLLATWLALSLSHSQDASQAKRGGRVLLYGLWGLIAGAAMWNDPLAAPFILMSGLFLLIFCRGELRKATLVCIALGFLIGLSPSVIYDFTVPLAQGTFSVFGFLINYGNTATPSHSLIDKLAGSLLVTLPVTTGAVPLCPVQTNEAWPISGQMSSYAVQCLYVRGGWSLVLLLLWAMAVVLAVSGLRKPWYRAWALDAPEERRTAILQGARLMLLGSAAFSFLVFTLSAQSVTDPWSNSRYLVGLAVVMPAVLWPLWAAVTGKSTWSRPAIGMAVLRYALLFIFGATLLKGTVDIFNQVPAAQAQAKQQQVLIHDLEGLGATHIYSDYWTCDLLIFLSRERVICATLDEKLGQGFDRYVPYRVTVENDLSSAYLFRLGSPQANAFAQRLARTGQQYRLTIVEGYALYQPVPAVTG